MSPPRLQMNTKDPSTRPLVCWVPSLQQLPAGHLATDHCPWSLIARTIFYSHSNQIRQPGSPQLSNESTAGDSVKNLTKVKVYYLHGSFLICRASHLAVEAIRLLKHDLPSNACREHLWCLNAAGLTVF